jgi:uncharacterized membrane protein YdbT with pleckstrin-like domain
MAYVDKILQPGESVRHHAYLHWLIYFPAFLPALLALAVVVLVILEIGAIDQTWRQVLLIGAALLALFALYKGLGAWVERFSTELVITDRRIIYKRGLIRRYTAEINMDKVETVLVEQGILGRLFNFGTITVRGTGGGLEPLPKIENPLAFRNHVTAA